MKHNRYVQAHVWEQKSCAHQTQCARHGKRIPEMQKVGRKDWNYFGKREAAKNLWKKDLTDK